MRFGCAISEDSESLAAADAVIGELVQAGLDKTDVLFVFLTGAHTAQAEEILQRVQEGLSPRSLIGASAEGVIGKDREVERSAGLAVLAGDLGGATVKSFHIGRDDWRRVLSEEDALIESLGHGGQTRALIGFGDPYSTPLRQLLEKIEEKCPELPLVGGMASSGRSPGENILLREDQVLDQGFVGITLNGAIDVQTVVSQGCRPVGHPVVVTKAHENVIEQIGGRPVLAALQEIVDSMPREEQQLLRNGLYIGRAIDEYRENWSRGDFLVRNVMGMEQATGGIGITDLVRAGQTVQFHVRDAATAEEDLRLLLEEQKKQDAPAGGLLFNCNGRGTRMFSKPCHDINATRAILPHTPIAGFFAAGELGPVGRRNFIHGHTASFALFRPRKD
ncbi:MAG TPA: FIST N-terminal domain-containing protein [Tepidisphaeraceae bacterium]|nr:FIST N-terminal domain-containing protein [Tepidisphaeraceae bacterium]